MDRFLRALRSITLTIALVAGIAVPALSLDRIQWWYGMNPPSSWHNQYERDVRLGFGQAMQDILQGADLFGNLCTTPGSGLYVSVGPCASNTLASLYQFRSEEATTFGGPGATALPVDPTQVMLQGLMSTSEAASIGPLNAPGTSGQSIIYAVECQVQTADTTSQTVNFVSSLGVVTSGSANRDRVDTIYCQSKAGTASSSPVAPTIDAGYIGVSLVTIAYGESTISSGNITTTTANEFTGFARAGVNNNFTVSQTVAGLQDTALSASSFLCSDGSQNLTSTCGILDTANGGTGANSFTSGRCVRSSSATVFASAAGDCVTGLTAGTGITVGSGTTPSVGISNGGVGQAQVLNGYVDTSTTQSVNAVKNFTEGVEATGAYVPPVYTVSGAAANYSIHAVIGTFSTTTSGICAAGTQCALTADTVSFSGAATFNSTPACASQSGGEVFIEQIAAGSGSMTLWAYNGLGASIASGTGVTFSFVCIGT